MAGVKTGDQFTLLKASAITQIKAGLETSVAAEAAQAQAAAIAAGAPLVTR